MKRLIRILTAISIISLLAATMLGCEMARALDPIVGEWQLVAENAVAPVLVTHVQFTANTYTASTAGIETYSGTWTKSSDTYSLTGTFLGFASNGSFAPTFSDLGNTLTYSSDAGVVYVYNRQL